jgi:hypothetical protein
MSCGHLLLLGRIYSIKEGLKIAIYFSKIYHDTVFQAPNETALL